LGNCSVLQRLTQAHQRGRLERLCRYITQPPIATQRLKRVFAIDIET
jgi:hypothetical protein